MNPRPRTFDPIWEDSIYGLGHQVNRYPYDHVVSFVHRHSPRGKLRDNVRILEVGCGAGNNLWFAAREGFRVAGIDASPSAIRYARARFELDGLAGDLVCGDLTRLPYETESFDLVIDRAAITCMGDLAARTAVAEIWRVLLPAGRFLFNPYSLQHSSAASGRLGEDGVTLDVAAGSLVGVGQIRFYGPHEIDDLFAGAWKIISRQHVLLAEGADEPALVQAEWRVIAVKMS